MNRYGAYGAQYFGDDTDTTGALIGQGLTDATKVILAQQNAALMAQQSWFTQTSVAGLPNWVLLAGVGLAGMVAYGSLVKGKSHGKHR